MGLTTPPRPLTEYSRRGIAAGSPVEKFIEGASQTYKAGAPIILASGKVIEATSPVNATNKAVGLAVAKATGVTNAEALSLALDPAYMLFEGTLSNATAGTHTLAQTDIGLIYPILKDSGTGNWYLDANATAAAGGFVVAAREPIGTVDARVIFRVTRGLIQGS